MILRQFCRDDIILDMFFGPADQIYVSDYTGQAELVLVFKIGTVTPLKNKDCQKVVSPCKQLRNVELRRVVSDLTLADVFPVEPHIEA